TLNQPALVGRRPADCARNFQLTTERRVDALGFSIETSMCRTTMADKRCIGASRYFTQDGESMTETLETPPLIESAEQAAASGDYASAERLLNEAALLQEASLGPVHPDLANTLNNLGVVCDRADKVDEAEYCSPEGDALT